MSTSKEITARDATLDLLSRRAPSATVCPSEVARAVARSRSGRDAEWRAEMTDVHAAIDQMVQEGLVALSWKGADMPLRSGPYRISRRTRRS
jgi:hypothetical protein